MTRRKLRVADDWEDDQPTQVVEFLPLAAGYNPDDGLLTSHDWRQHRGLQVERALAFLYVRAHSDPAGDRYSVQDAANMLRALPGAPLPELLHGRMT